MTKSWTGPGNETSHLPKACFTITYLEVLDGTGGKRLVVPAAVAEGAGNGLGGGRVTLSQREHTLGGGGEGTSCDIM